MWLKKVRFWFEGKINEAGYYRIEDLQTWGRCGCCGRLLENKIYPKDWPWGVCDGGCISE